jgi:hypothetical protein
MVAVDTRPHPGDLLSLAFELINARGADYDKANNIEQNFREAAAVASVIIDKPVTARDVAMIMHCVKLIRSKSAPEKIDNYVDGMNYLAFAACFQGLVPLPPLGAREMRDTTKEVVKLKAVDDDRSA